MHHYDPEYQQGFDAALAGKSEADCPYEDKNVEKPDDYMSSTYTFNSKDAWMYGFKKGKEACPHCRGTGKKPELTKEQRARKGLFLHNLKAEVMKPR